MSWCHSTGRNCAPAADFGDSVKPTVSFLIRIFSRRVRSINGCDVLCFQGSIDILLAVKKTLKRIKCLYQLKKRVMLKVFNELLSW